MPRVMPDIVRICERCSGTMFTRFIPARRPGEGKGIWRRYYEPVGIMTKNSIGVGHGRSWRLRSKTLVPPDETVDKPVDSPWLGSRLHGRLRARDSIRSS